MEILDKVMIVNFWHNVLPPTVHTKQNAIVWYFYDNMPEECKRFRRIKQQIP